MFENYLNILGQIGFDSKCRGAIFISSIVSEVISLLEEGIQDEEILKRLPSLYLEDYHFFFEVGRFKYFDEINKCISSRNVKGKKSVKIKFNSTDSFIINFSKYCRSLEKVDENNKELKKV